MKRIGLFLLAVVMVAGLAGCPNKDHVANVVGTWVVAYDWGCNGTGYSDVWHIHNNGTFIDSYGYSGTFDVNGDVVTLKYPDYPFVISSGTVDGDTMAGTMTTAEGSRGCWTATRTSATP